MSIIPQDHLPANLLSCCIAYPFSWRSTKSAIASRYSLFANCLVLLTAQHIQQLVKHLTRPRIHLTILLGHENTVYNVFASICLIASTPHRYLPLIG
jgi:hypothetical protein